MQKPLFILVISGTETIKHPGISAAGASHEMLAYTAALDAEYIYHGKTKTLEDLPISPSGIVSPALITKACLDKLGYETLIVDAGSHIKPQAKYHAIKEKPGKDISTGKAMELEEVNWLFEKGKKFSQEIKNQKVIISECVVGGTTTALGVLTALGFQASGMVSSSLPEGNHQLKEEIIKEGLKNTKYTQEEFKSNPLTAIAALGDPMQAFVAGFCSKSQSQITLAGGTQMLAIKAITCVMSSSKNGIDIATSPWVVEDKSAKFMELAQLCCPGTQINYVKNIHVKKIIKSSENSLSPTPLELTPTIEHYDQGHVKEGVGMGAMLYELFLNSNYSTYENSPTDQLTFQ